MPPARGPGARPLEDTAPLTVVGIGADGWLGLAEKARNAVLEADVVLGSPRQLAMLPDGLRTQAWPSPLLPALDDVLEDHAGHRVCVLASGDPLLSGIATTLRDRGHEIEVQPALSSVTLARARLAWSFEETEVITVVGRAIQRVARALAPKRRILVLGANAEDLRELLRARGYGDSTLTSLENLGADDERVRDGWTHDPGPLTVFALVCAGPALPLTGLPDDAFEHDGQLTKRDVRASALAHLAPVPGELLWDVGAGAGSVGIEWSRAHPLNRAVAIERDSARAERVTRNAATLGVPELRVVTGPAPEVLAGLPRPDAIFVGGGLTVPGLLDACLATGARVVAHGVTLEAEQILAHAYSSRGGELTRIAVDHARPLGGFTGWTPSRTVTSWSSR
ncbi:precorrin-6y C5,15-methyltransferase (decarboxylating) subunit CbiE [Amycolatopsis rhabdoformis]|uniref:Precorrin-6y C5,15-methyltransferase (Decarboxylating) subunit CbiE n=1 Tax=Amycolatopsis rhabdoformis TaxID=1448059 RepID=A0ABZ1HXG9_9PSEU|nr:precorrin-6y C5,15-methyltransferase (decarboxylating) subunit CbiE [Amycolatopsis rhabdoformis]WSE26065.1 precorrin-6y C5,15-methyltransferase (decarboxylating) subunit CbiE [Amycolatopsis rhabdoformis]